MSNDKPSQSDHPIKFPSPENAAVANKSHHKPRANDRIDWTCRLFDSEGFEHRLIDLGGVQVVTKIQFCYAIWDRRSGECISHPTGDSISNAPLTDIQKTQRHQAALDALRTMYPANDPRRIAMEANLMT